MKKLGIITSLCCALVLSLALFGCGGGSGSGSASGQNDAEAAKAAFKGTWDLVSMTQNGEETSKDDISMLAALGLEVYLNLNEDGTAELVFFGESMSGSWEASSTTQGSVTLDGSAVEMKIEGENLLMEQSNASLTFKKGTARSASSQAAASKSSAAASSAAAASAASADAAAAEGEEAEDADVNVDEGENMDEVDVEVTDETDEGAVDEGADGEEVDVVDEGQESEE